MLKLLRRKHIRKNILYVLAAIIIPAFVIWGSSSVMQKEKVPTYAGVVFKHRISFDEFRHAYDGWQVQLKLQYGEKAREIASSFFNPSQAAWDRLILLYETKTRRIKIKDSELISAITNMPFLQKDNQFDPQAYELFLKYSLGIQPRVFEDFLKENLKMAKIFEQVTSDLKLTDDEIHKEYIRQNEQARVKYVSFSPKDYKDKINLTDNDLKAAYDKNREKFKIPPQINASFIGIDFKETTSVDEKTKAHDALKHILAKTKNKKFEDAAKEENLTIKNTGLFGFQDPIPSFGWMPQLSSVLFDLSSGAISKIIELDRGVYVFKIDEKKDAYVPEFKDAKEKIKTTILTEKEKEMAQKKASAFLVKIKDKPDMFEKTATDEKLSVKETPLFSREGYIQELGMATNLKDAAFKLSPNAIAGEVIELEQGFYVIKLLEITKIEEEKFKKEKEEFSKQSLEQKRTKAFNDFFEGLKKSSGLISYVDNLKLN